MKTRCLLFLLGMGTGLMAQPLSVHTDFEGGSAGEVKVTGGSTLSVAAAGEHDQDRRNRQPSWFYFRVDGAAGRDLTIDINRLDGEYNYRPHNGSGHRHMRPVYSYDNREWRHFENSEWNGETSTIRVRLKAAGERVWIARQAPYTNAHLARLLDALSGSPCLRKQEVGKTAGGRPMLLLTITNPGTPESGKKVIWLMARQHSWESGTSWVCEGALRFLLSAEPAAARIRDSFVFKVFPMADPDGVARGGVRFNVHGYDLNRNWDTADAARMPEIYFQRKTMLEWLDGGGRMDLFLTLHNTESVDFVEGPAAEAGERLWKLLDAHSTFYSPGGLRHGSAEPKKGRMSANQALFQMRKAPAYLMELMVDASPRIARPHTVADRLEFGGALVRAMAGAVK